MNEYNRGAPFSSPYGQPSGNFPRLPSYVTHDFNPHQWGPLPEEPAPLLDPTPEPKSRRKTLFVPILIIIFLVFIGAVVAGTVGSRISAERKNEADVSTETRLVPIAQEGPGTTSTSSVSSTTSSSAPIPLPTAFLPVYGANATVGIGGYDLRSPADQMFAFDYDHSGKADHLALYRPGTGTFWILQNRNGSFSPLYHEGDPGHGIGGYDLKSPADRAFAFDYDHSGKLDHIALYRPGTGTFWILRNRNGTFSPVYHEGDPGHGIGGYDLKSPADRAFAFDYEQSGRLDYIALYRPGTGTFWILKNTGGVFSAVYHQGDPGNGIGGYDLKSPADRAFAFDYGHTGMLDHLAFFRPGTGTFWILQNVNGTFQAVFHQGDPGAGVGSYNLLSTADLIFPFDYEHSGHVDHLACYRPGTGTFWILKNQQGTFSPVYHEGDPGHGIGGYDLGSAADRVIAFDFSSVGRLDALTFYRPGTGRVVILTRGGL